MKKIYIITFLAMLFATKSYTQTCDLEFLNFVQTNETEFRYDVRIRNTGVSDFAIDSWNTNLNFDSAILNEGSFSSGYYLFLLPGSSQLANAIYPQFYNAGAGNNFLSNGPDVLNNNVITTVLNPGVWVNIGTFIVKLRDVDDYFGTPSKAHNFGSVLPNLIPPSNPTNAVGWCTYNAISKRKIAGPIGTVVTTVINSLTNKPLYSYCFTGNGNYNNAANWNNNVDPTDASYHKVPTVTTNSISIGSINNFDDINSIDIGSQSGNSTLNLNKTVNNLFIETSSSLTLNSGTQFSVDGTIFKDNLSNTALTLKAGGGITPTASLKNNTAGVNATIEDFIPSWGNINDNLGWHLIAAPVSGQVPGSTFTDPTPANYDLYAYDPAQTNCWINHKVSPISSFGNGIGYLASYSTGINRNFVGNMNVGDVSPALVYSTVSFAASYNLIGNPYPCAIDANMNNWTNKSNVNLSVWILGGDGVYKSSNSGIGDFTEIPAMQGFFISTTGVAPTVTIPSTSKQHSISNTYKSASINNYLKLTAESPNNTKATTYIYFKNTNQNTFDEHDAMYMPSMSSSNTQLYSYINTDKVSINALAEYAAPYIVNLGFEPKTNGIFTIKAAEIASFTASSHIYLQDLKTNTTQDLALNPDYLFTASVTDDVNRFKVLFDLGQVGVNNNTANIENDIYSFDKSIYIKSSDKVSSVSIYNLLGQEILKVLQPTSNVITLSQLSGYYIVRVVTNNKVYSQKIYIK